MHMSTSTLAIAIAFGAALYLLFFDSPNKMFATIATIVAGIELLLTLGVMSLALAKFRIDVILPALLAISGVLIWGKSSSKGGVTAATTVSLIGVTQLLLVLHPFK